MTTYAHDLTLNDIPGLVTRHYVFQNDPRFYDGVTGDFIDQSPLSTGERKRNCRTASGAPTWSSLAGKGLPGITLDRTWKGSILNPIPFEGAIIAEFEIYTPSGTVTIYPLISDVAANANNVFNWRIQKSSGNVKMLISNASYAVNDFANNTIAQSDPAIALGGCDQVNNVAYRSLDGATITTTAASAVTTSGWPCAPSGDLLWRLGDVNNDSSNTAQADYIKLHRLMFLKGRPTTAGDLAKLSAFFTSRIAALG